ncbi:MAG: hypothetical protein GXP30_15005 [Verrucomicrobia bacterium]|nr:hypothetical protein [Verrucomicrobiota bacterium]
MQVNFTMHFYTLTRTIFTILIILTVFISRSSAELLIGQSTTNITPDLPVALSGQMHTRIAKKIETPVTASVVVLESKDSNGKSEQAILVSCDLVAIREGILDGFRAKLKEVEPDIDGSKIIINATHTHTAPVMDGRRYSIPKTGVTQPLDYREFLYERLVKMTSEAWKNRKPGGVSWGLGHAVVAHNRRIVYTDGHAQMYGKTALPSFKKLEGAEDHGVEVLFFFDANKKLIAAAVNVACPGQEVESRSAVNADYWHDVREQLKKKHGKDLVVLSWVGAAGDQSPHLMLRKAAENRMVIASKRTRLQEIGRRIARAVDDAWLVAKNDVHFDAPMIHTVRDINLPVRKVTKQELAVAKKAVTGLKASHEKTGKDVHRRLLWHQRTIDRFAKQNNEPYYSMELHVMRLGDVALVTNPFELFTEYGLRMKSRSNALQTFVIQLSGSSGAYLPTDDAVRGGSYSAIVNSNFVGPEGGDILTDETVKGINSLWGEK